MLIDEAIKKKRTKTKKKYPAIKSKDMYDCVDYSQVQSKVSWHGIAP